MISQTSHASDVVSEAISRGSAKHVTSGAEHVKVALMPARDVGVTEHLIVGLSLAAGMAEEQGVAGKLETEMGGEAILNIINLLRGDTGLIHVTGDLLGREAGMRDTDL